MPRGCLTALLHCRSSGWALLARACVTYGIFYHGPRGLAGKLHAPGRVSLRFLTRRCGDPLQVSPAKKARAGQDEPSMPPSSPLSPEQLDRIQRNKAAALLRLAARNVPVGFGDSWKKHLSGEFGKPYFIKVDMEVYLPQGKLGDNWPLASQIYIYRLLCFH